MTNPLLFYLWEHSEIHQLYTPHFDELLQRADAIYMEFPCDYPDIVTEIEREVNNYRATGIFPKRLRDSELTTETYLARKWVSTQKRIILERYPECTFDHNAEDRESMQALVTQSLERGMEKKRQFYGKSTAYQRRREEAVLEQILAIPETTIVLFGAGHKNLAREAQRRREIEIIYSYPFVSQSFGIQGREYFEREGRVDRELYLREFLEDVSNAGLRKGYDLVGEEKDILAHEIAVQTSIEDIESYARRMKLGIGFIDPGDLFKQFVKGKEEIERRIETAMEKSSAIPRIAGIDERFFKF